MCLRIVLESACRLPAQSLLPDLLHLVDSPLVGVCTALVCPDRMTLPDAADYFLLSMVGIVSKTTVEFYRRRLPVLVDYFGDVSIETITLEQLRAWRQCLAGRALRYRGTARECSGGLSVYTIHQYIRVTRRLFRWLLDEGKISHNPAKRLELPKLPAQPRRGIPQKSRDAMCHLCSTTRDRAILAFLWSTACRVGGLAGLLLEDLYLHERRAIVREKGRGGSQKLRWVFLDPECVDAVAAYLIDRPPSDDPHVFLGKSRGQVRPLSEGGIYQVVQRIAQAAGVKKYNPHEWRHARIRHWLNNRMPLKTASQLAGHSTIKTTADIYGTSSEEELLEAFDKYS